MVDYAGLVGEIKTASLRQQALQPRLDKLTSQLRSALLSSRTHLRKVFRDLDGAKNGTITMSAASPLVLRPPIPPPPPPRARGGFLVHVWRLRAHRLAPGCP